KIDVLMIRLFRHTVLFLLFFLGGLVAEESKPYLKYADQIIHQFEKECVKEFKVVRSGSGGRMSRDVEQISVDFMAYRIATIEEARRLEVTLTEKLLKKINENEKIRPYLREFPFPYSRARVSVSFHKRDNSPNTDGSVAHVFQARNKIVYSGADPKTEDLYDLLEEPYEEALNLVNK
ncbi:MAG: hypothetical protein ACHQT8_06295, partial [Chlamydiales bacterium]